MKARILTLLLAALVAGAFCVGCNKTEGATEETATTSTPSSTTSDPNFTPADPGAKAAMQLKQADEDNKAATSKAPDPATSPPGSAPAATPAGQGTAGDGASMPKPGEKVAVLDTNKGTIIFKFLTAKAPKTVKNFQDLANKKFYDGTKFHRVIHDFMIQGGDPNTKGTDTSSYGMGGPGYTIPDEFNDVNHTRGIVSMAHTGAANSGGSQFFICVGNPTFLNGKYAAFGQVVKGMDVADKIVNLPVDSPQHNMPTPDEAVVKSIRIETWPVKA